MSPDREHTATKLGEKLAKLITLAIAELGHSLIYLTNNVYNYIEIGTADTVSCHGN